MEIANILEQIEQINKRERTLNGAKKNTRKKFKKNQSSKNLMQKQSPSIEVPNQKSISRIFSNLIVVYELNKNILAILWYITPSRIAYECSSFKIHSLSNTHITNKTICKK